MKGDMNSTYRSGQATVARTVINSTVTTLVLGGLLLCVATAHAGGGKGRSIVKALVRPGSTNEVASSSNVVALASGTVKVEEKGGTQRFIVEASNVPVADKGLGVFIGNNIDATNGAVFVNALAVKGEKSTWSVELENSNGGPPPFLGVDNLDELVGKYVFVADTTTNVVLLTRITPLVPKLSATSYRTKVKLNNANPAPSPKAKGLIRVKYDGKTGASLLEVTSRNLAAGNAYCVVYTSADNPSGVDCTGGDSLVDGRGTIKRDTGKGTDLPFGIEDDVTTVKDLAGLNVFIIDAFGAVHQFGQIPGGKK